MAPDVEELIRRVNTLTLDKNRLKQKLLQLTNEQNGKDAIMMLNQMSLQQQSSQDSVESSPGHNHLFISAPKTTNKQTHSPPNDRLPSASSATSQSRSNIIAGVECTTSSEDDLRYMNDLLRKRLDEYEDNWSFIQSKCSALQSELTALQMHHARLMKEKLEAEEKFKQKCDECDDIRSELKTVALNYETQLGTMSEHLSSKINCAERF